MPGFFTACFNRKSKYETWDDESIHKKIQENEKTIQIFNRELTKISEYSPMDPVGFGNDSMLYFGVASELRRVEKKTEKLLAILSERKQEIKLSNVKQSI